MDVFIALAISFTCFSATILLYSCNDLSVWVDAIKSKPLRTAVTLTLVNEFFWLALVGVFFALLFLA